jgi:hypothetical protein
MNLRRGFHRLFVVFAVSWYLLGALFLYNAWSDHYSTQKANLDRCLAAVRDVNGKPLPPLPKGYEDYKLVDQLTESSCREHWIVAPVDERVETAFVLLFPMVLYGMAKILVWIGRGFRQEPSTPS